MEEEERKFWPFLQRVDKSGTFANGIGHRPHISRPQVVEGQEISALNGLCTIYEMII